MKTTSLPGRIVRFARGVWAGISLLRDPNRLDMVFVLDDAVSPEAAQRVADHARTHARGRAALAERPRVHLDLAQLRALPEGTFGRAVAAFFDDAKLDPASIPQKEAHDDATYAEAHLYETHDIWHVATGFETDVAGEIALQAFYATQMPGQLPRLLVAGGLFQAALWVRDDFDRRLDAVARGRELGKRATPLFGVRWQEMFERPLADVRAELGTA